MQIIELLLFYKDQIYVCLSMCCSDWQRSAGCSLWSLFFSWSNILGKPHVTFRVRPLC